MERKEGHYWVQVGSEDPVWTIGYYDGSGTYPWQIIGSDDIFTEEEITRIDETPVCKRYY